MPDFEKLFENMNLAEKILSADLIITRLIEIMVGLVSEAGDDLTGEQLKAAAGQIAARRNEFMDRLRLR